MVSLDRILRQRRARTSRPSTRRRQSTRARALGVSRAPRRQSPLFPRGTGATVAKSQQRRGGRRPLFPRGTGATVAKSIQRRGSRTVRDEGLTAEDLAALLLAGGGFGGGGGGGGGGLSAADRRAEISLQGRLDDQAAKDQRDFDADQARIAQEIEDKRIADALEERRQSDIRGLRGERQSRFVDLIGRDQARAVLFALGLGPQADIFTARASQLESTLPALKGARTLELETEAALAQLLGKDIDIGARGVSGLGPAQGAATAFQRGGLSAQQLLSSAFGVGDLGTGRQPGIGADELRRIVESVTPRGSLV